MTLDSSFPFDHVIITFPDARSAALAQERFENSDSSYRTYRITCTCDPYNGTRVGSAGGTAAALIDHPYDNDDETVLILHAGGAASRTPTQMILGKAWTTFPSSLSVSKWSQSTTTMKDSPRTSHGVTLMDLWLSCSQHLFQRIPRSSIVVIAADTLLELEDGIFNDATSNHHYEQPWIDWNQAFMEDTDRGGIVCLAVPAPLETAQNHGVFVLDNSSSVQQNSHPDHDATASTSRAIFRPCHRMLQKPSLLELSSISIHTEDVWWRENDDDDDDEVTKTVWIDTGVTLFGPSAACAFRHLAQYHMQSCTATGLRNLFHQQQQQPASAHSDVEAIPTSWLRQHAVSVDLYTHILRAVMVDISKESYLQIHQNDGLSNEMLSTIYDTLSVYSPLRILAIPKGRFWHLGTTRELYEFMVYGAGHCDIHKDDPKRNITRSQKRRIQRCQEFGKKLQLCRRLQTFITLGAVEENEETGDSIHEDDNTRCSNKIDESAVIESSVLVVDVNCSMLDTNTSQETERHQNSIKNGSMIGTATMIEYSYIETACRIHIGNHCFISGFRTAQKEEEIYIPDHSMVLMTRIISKLENEHESQKTTNSSSYAIVVLGIFDSIKERVTSLFGIPVHVFLREMDVHDVWDASDSTNDENSFWNAKIHPTISFDEGQSFSSVYAWLRLLDFEKNDIPVSKLQADDSFQNWKKSKRLSLSEIREVADAGHEFAFRDSLWNSIPRRRSDHLNRQLCAILKFRKNYPPFDVKYIVDEFASALTTATFHSSNQIADGIAIFSTVKETLQAWDGIVRESLLAECNHDIASRTCMMMSSFLDELAKNVPPRIYEDDSILLNKITDILAQSVLALHCTTEELLRTHDELAFIRDEHLTSATILAALSKKFEDFAGILTGKHICLAPGAESSLRCRKPIYDQWILATAPARIDLAGGWTDTPPICYEYGGCVTGAAILVDGRFPLACRCRISRGMRGVYLATESRDIENGDLSSKVEVDVCSIQELMDGQDPTSCCALLKCTLLQLGLVPTLSMIDRDAELQPLINFFCCSNENVRMEIIATSLLPQGSGLGTSSILAGCVVTAISKCIGAGRQTSQLDMRDIINSVLSIEQYLTTGGGYQDQANGLIGGIKMVSSYQNGNPMTLSIDHISVSDDFRRELDRRLVLVYTGTTRLAKNLLRNVVRRWAKRTSEIVKTVSRLVEGSKKCRGAVDSANADLVGECLSEYWAQKKIMAGLSSGVAPKIISEAMATLHELGLVRGASLCGAGGGGFMVLLTAEGVSQAELKDSLEQHGISNFTWHDCCISQAGLSLQNLGPTIEKFDLSWLTPKK